MSESTSKLPTVAVVLAAGRGTRMRSNGPKVLHRAAGKPLLEWVLRAASNAGCTKALVVVGHQSDIVRSACEDFQMADGLKVEWVEQTEQKGTGDALARAVAALDSPSRLVVLSGDVPLVRGETLGAMLDRAGSGWLLAVAELDDPGSLGRVLSDGHGDLARIVEAADANAEELEVASVNAGLYVAPSAEIEPFLAGLTPGNSQGELYLTDAFTEAAGDGTRVALFELPDASEALGVNDRSDLASVHRVLLDRKCDELMKEGVTVYEPGRTVIEAGVEVGADSEIHPGATLLGTTSLGAGVVVHAGAWIRDSRLGDGVEIGPMSVVDGADVERHSRVGPFARLRPGARLGAQTRVGNFVEIKNSRLGDGVKAGHLAYLGDAEVGAGANIGAGTVTCNYDGENKHRTQIGSGAFVGSDTMLVAPVRVGDNATTAAGSVITQDVPDGALGVERSRQKNLDGWAERKRARRSKD